MTGRIGGTMVRTGGREGVTTHGMARTRIYNIWADMIGRCTRPAHARYADYGGRGITVCERWREFANFYADMGDRPAGRSLDRINNDAGYSPDNCRWATFREQRHNRRAQAPREVCMAGLHPLSGDNLYIFPSSGKRRCRACHEAWRQARKVAAA